MKKTKLRKYIELTLDGFNIDGYLIFQLNVNIERYIIVFNINNNQTLTLKELYEMESLLRADVDGFNLAFSNDHFYINIWN